MHVLLSYKDMKDKSRKLSSILKEIKSYQLVSIRLLDFGMLKLENFFKFWKDMKIKSFHACTITKEIQLLPDLKIIRAKFGETHKCTKRNEIFFIRL